MLASSAFHIVEDAPFRLFCNQRLAASERTGERTLSLQLSGGEGCTALMAVVRTGRHRLSECRLMLADGDAVGPALVADDRIEFHVAAAARVILSWSEA